MKDLLYVVLALVSAAVAAYSFYSFQSSGSTTNLIVAIVFLILTIAFGIGYLYGRVNKTDDIHITE